MPFSAPVRTLREDARPPGPRACSKSATSPPALATSTAHISPERPAPSTATRAEGGGAGGRAPPTVAKALRPRDVAKAFGPAPRPGAAILWLRRAGGSVSLAASDLAALAVRLAAPQIRL